MAKTYGYGLQAFAGGFQTGLGLGMENKKIKMLQEEQKRAEKLAKEKEENAMLWYNSNKDSLMNFHTQPQDTRNMLIFESVQYKKEWTDYLRDVEDFLQSGDLESLKNLNNMQEEKIKAERDMLGLGIRPENAFVGKYYSEKDMEYVKKLQIGKLPIKPIGKKMYEEEFGELPPETKEPDLTSAINYLKKFPNPTPEQFNSLRTGAEKYFNVDLSNVTQKSLWEPEKPTPEPKITPPVPTTIENIREDIASVDTVEDARRIYKNYVNKYGTEGIDIPEGDVDKFWADSQIPYLEKIKTSIGNILDERGWLKKGTLTSAEVGLDFKGDQPVEEIYKMLRVEYMKYREMLEKLGIDISQFPKLKTLEEIEKVGFGEGFWGFGKQRGQYKSIYYNEKTTTPIPTVPKLPKLPSL